MRYLILVSTGEKLEFKAGQFTWQGRDLEIWNDGKIMGIFPINNVVYIISMDHVTTVSE